ncbi:MAG: hypothetical protein JJT94_04365 [Bernardetiaceae bacterium]|nr:hypothetical protein [Bernardetiaceae bacterium]
MDKFRSFLDYLSQNQELGVFVGILAIFLLILFLLFIRLLFVADKDTLTNIAGGDTDENWDLQRYLQQLKEVAQQTRLAMVEIEREVATADAILLEKYQEIEKCKAQIDLLKSEVQDLENINPKLIRIKQWRLFFIGLLLGTLITGLGLLAYYWFAIKS